MRARQRLLKENFFYVKEEYCNLVAKNVLHNKDCPDTSKLLALPLAMDLGSMPAFAL
jgi:hypothetical protein